jgi:hypothetical protein
VLGNEANRAVGAVLKAVRNPAHDSTARVDPLENYSAHKPWVANGAKTAPIITTAAMSTVRPACIRVSGVLTTALSLTATERFYLANARLA